MEFTATLSQLIQKDGIQYLSQVHVLLNLLMTADFTSIKECSNEWDKIFQVLHELSHNDQITDISIIQWLFTSQGPVHTLYQFSSSARVHSQRPESVMYTKKFTSLIIHSNTTNVHGLCISFLGNFKPHKFIIFYNPWLN